MAGGARQRFVCTEERVAGRGNMVEHGIVPSVLRMAREAGVRETAPCVLQLVVRLVTRDAVIGCSRREEEFQIGTRVAGGTRQRLVRTEEWVTSCSHMVENRIVPSVLRMTREAGVRETAPCVLQLVVRLVTRDAVIGRSRREEEFQIGAGVAGGTRQRFVRTEERVTCRGNMVKLRVRPSLLGVTREAGVRETATGVL
jgi:hypothetical protein